MGGGGAVCVPPPLDGVILRPLSSARARRWSENLKHGKRDVRQSEIDGKTTWYKTRDTE